MEDKRKKNLVLLYKRGAMCITVVAILILAAIAWFVQNKQVESNGMNVTAANLSFELEVRGNIIENSDIMTSNDFLFKDEFSNGVQQEDGLGNLVNIFRTGAKNEKIVWRKESSLYDYSNGISPGAEGKLTFYVIPKRDGVLNATFDFNIRGYHAVYDDDTLDELIEITDELEDSSELRGKGITSVETKQNALKYINDHMLFFREYDDDEKVYSEFCADKIFEFNDFIEGNDKSVVKDHAYPVTVYWIWVNDFGDIFLPSTSQYSYKPILGDSNVTDREAIWDYINDLDNNVFCSVTDEDITDAFADIEDDTSVTYRDSLAVLTTGYDNADLEIGNNINYILIEMTAQER